MVDITNFGGEVASGVHKFLLIYNLRKPYSGVQWAPNAASVINCLECVFEHEVVISSHNYINDNYISIGKIQLWNHWKRSVEIQKFSNMNQLHFKCHIKHDGPVNRMRIMPQNSNLIATKSRSPYLKIFDSSKYSYINPNKTDQRLPELVLRGHNKGGFALDWNKLLQGYIVSGSEDKNICLWDINHKSEFNHFIDPLRNFIGHTDNVMDIKWNNELKNVFGSVGKDKYLKIWDDRLIKPIINIVAHSGPINSISFSPFSSYAYATGSSDTTIRIWDMRKPNLIFNSFDSNSHMVKKVEWSPHTNNILASIGSNNFVHIWDQSMEANVELLGKRPEGKLLFTYKDHATYSKVTDFGWNFRDPWIMTSIANNMEFHVWEIPNGVN